MPFEKCDIIVGHAIHNDVDMLREFAFDSYELRDTQLDAEYYSVATGSSGASLRPLARVFLGEAFTKRHIRASNMRSPL